MYVLLLLFSSDCLTRFGISWKNAEMQFYEEDLVERFFADVLFGWIQRWKFLLNRRENFLYLIIKSKTRQRFREREQGSRIVNGLLKFSYGIYEGGAEMRSREKQIYWKVKRSQSSSVV